MLTGVRSPGADVELELTLRGNEIVGVEMNYIEVSEQ
jgi:hypothetical protein